MLSLPIYPKESGLALVFKLEARVSAFFKQLSQSFIDHFISSQKKQKWSDYPHTVKQKERETIRAFISCFNMATLEVCNLDWLVAMSVLMSSLQKNDFKRLLIKTYPRDFMNMLAWAKKCVRIEDTFMQKEPPPLLYREVVREYKPIKNTSRNGKKGSDCTPSLCERRTRSSRIIDLGAITGKPIRHCHRESSTHIFC